MKGLTELYRIRLGRLLLAAVDVLLVHVAFYVAFLLRFGFALPPENMQPYLKLWPLSTCLALAVFYAFDLYSGFRRRPLDGLLYSVLLAVLVFNLVNIVMVFWLRGFAFPRSVMILAGVLHLIFLGLSRIVVWYFIKLRFGRKRVLVVAESFEKAEALCKKFRQHGCGWFVPGDWVRPGEKNALPKLRDHQVVLLSPSLSQQVKSEILSLCAREKKEVLLVPDLYELFVLNAHPEQVDDVLVLSIQPPGLTPSQRVVKRLFDLVIATLLLVVSFPIMASLWLLIPLTSKGPALYTQERLGLNGKPFRLYKFRTMVHDAEKYTGPVLAGYNDPRVTPIGRILRASRLDELPQLVNVLKGDMSIVGPRPERPQFAKQFAQSIDGYAYRMTVRPGLTGLAQVMGKYTTTPEDKLRFDLMYIHHYSFLLDLKILFQTARVILQKEKATGIHIETPRMSQTP